MIDQRKEDMRTINWGILGPGKISRAFAAGLNEAAGARITAVGSRDLGRAEAFAEEYGATHAFGSYEELAACPGIDAIYIGSPHSGHEPHTVLCLEAGKHVLCEKPLAVNAAQAERMINLARQRNLALMEALWTRFLPAIVKARELVASGAIGEVRMLQADFGFRADFDPESRLFAPELAGGALLDVGIYPLNLAFMLFGAPEEILTTANLGTTGVDEEAACLLRHAQGRLSVLSFANRLDTPREAHILGTDGRITICFPWWGATRIELHAGGEQKDFDYPHWGGGLTYQAEAFMDMIRSGNHESDVMPLDESLAIMKTMDEIRSRWGLYYPGE
jgi:predicted dehydrogenase